MLENDDYPFSTSADLQETDFAPFEPPAPFTYADVVAMLRDILLNGESDLHIQADAAPTKRNLQRKLEEVEGRIWNRPARVIPEETVFRLAYTVCRGTPFTKRLLELEAHTTFLREKYQSTCVNLDEEYLMASEDGGNLESGVWRQRILFAEDDERSQLVFEPFDTVFDVKSVHPDLEQEIFGRYRVHVFRAEPMRNLGAGLCLSFRRIYPVLPTYLELGFSMAANNLVSDLFNGNISSGLVLVVGSTGSGKSTTVAAMLEAINEKLPVNITLLEDPPEYRFTNKRARFRQISIGRDVPSYADGAYHALRQDPDIIVVGEIRDKEMAQRAMAIAKTGHLVFGTMHSTTNAPAALVKFLQWMNFDHYAMSFHLQAVIAQKLVEPKDEYDPEGNANPPVLVQEVIRPQKNQAIRRLLQTRCENPFEYYRSIGQANDETTQREETFGEALKQAVSKNLIFAQTALKAAERDEDPALKSLESNKKPLRTSGKQQIPDWLRNRTLPTDKEPEEKH